MLQLIVMHIGRSRKVALRYMDMCRFGKCNSRGELIRKRLGFIVDEELGEYFHLNCNCGVRHPTIEGSETRMSMIYPDDFVDYVLQAIFASRMSSDWRFGMISLIGLLSSLIPLLYLFLALSFSSRSPYLSSLSSITSTSMNNTDSQQQHKRTETKADTKKAKTQKTTHKTHHVSIPMKNATNQIKHKAICNANINKRNNKTKTGNMNQNIRTLTNNK